MALTRRQFGLAQAALLALLGASAPLLAAAQDADVPQNVFISPCGQPFRAKIDAPYPVGDWFKQADKNADGRLDHAEFLADAAAFFKTLDLNGDGVLSGYEVEVYEQNVAPEILGQRVTVGLGGSGRARLWLAQSSMDPGGGGDSNAFPPKQKADESKLGAAPYSLLQAPEPVAAADLSFSGRISKGDFLRLADLHFTTLDRDGNGYLTLAGLPKTEQQQRVEKYQREHRTRS